MGITHENDTICGASTRNYMSLQLQMSACMGLHGICMGFPYCLPPDIKCAHVSFQLLGAEVLGDSEVLSLRPKEADSHMAVSMAMSSGSEGRIQST